MKLIGEHIDQIRQLCTQNTVRSLFAFGSITRADFKSSSDVDLLVDIESNDPMDYADKYFSLKFNLENLFERQIDLLEQKAINNPYLKSEIEQTKILVYGK